MLGDREGGDRYAIGPIRLANAGSAVNVPRSSRVSTSKMVYSTGSAEAGELESMKRIDTLKTTLDEARNGSLSILQSHSIQTIARQDAGRLHFHYLDPEIRQR